MDTGLEKFVPISETKAMELTEVKSPYFMVGEELEIKGSKFKVHHIYKNRMMLKLLPK